jgi:hypothetical protein
VGGGAGQQLAIYGRVPNAQLVESSGRTMQLGDLKGTVWVADFIFTRCAGTCQVMSRKMANLQKSLQKAGNVKLVSITVDPEFDTPDRLTNFAKLYQAKDDRWLFLTGGEKQIQRLATEAFKLPLMEGTDPNEPIICLNHNPANARELLKYPWQWMLAGHTHGRQIANSRIGKRFYPKLYRHYTHGYYMVEGRHLYVNRGLSYGQRVRYWCRPEVTVFRLTCDEVQNGETNGETNGESNGESSNGAG